MRLLRKNMIELKNSNQEINEVNQVLINIDNTSDPNNPNIPLNIPK